MQAAQHWVVEAWKNDRLACLERLHHPKRRFPIPSFDAHDGLGTEYMRGTKQYGSSMASQYGSFDPAELRWDQC
jgi:hypothetical protein